MSIKPVQTSSQRSLCSLSNIKLFLDKNFITLVRFIKLNFLNLKEKFYIIKEQWKGTKENKGTIKSHNVEGRLKEIKDQTKCLICGYTLNISGLRKHMLTHN